jgi:GNAT superfamily N-acetyltransferase
VDEGHRGKGLGSALVRRMEELARERVDAELPLFTQGSAEPTERAYYLRKQL